VRVIAIGWPMTVPRNKQPAPMTATSGPFGKPLKRQRLRGLV
jgi:hypothetical protein